MFFRTMESHVTRCRLCYGAVGLGWVGAPVHRLVGRGAYLHQPLFDDKIHVFSCDYASATTGASLLGA